MLYLIVFSALALGFYAQSSLSAQLSSNERRLNESQAAAESGLQFMRYWLSSLDIPGDKPKDKVLEEVYMQLAGKLEPTATMGGQLLDYVAITPKLLTETFLALDEELDPLEDQQATPAMRRHLAKVLLARCVSSLLDRPDLRAEARA